MREQQEVVDTLAAHGFTMLVSDDPDLKLMIDILRGLQLFNSTDVLMVKYWPSGDKCIAGVGRDGSVCDGTLESFMRDIHDKQERLNCDILKRRKKRKAKG